MFFVNLSTCFFQTDHDTIVIESSMNSAFTLFDTSTSYPSVKPTVHRQFTIVIGSLNLDVTK